MLSQRATSVLKILVDQYVQTASPVASEDIARLSSSKVSPATVRNAMSQLTEEGYISRPHVSSGGIPSDMGYRHYVESLGGVPELPAGVRRQIHAGFDRTEPDTDAWCQQCASVLSRITGNLCIVTIPMAQSPRLKQIQLVYVKEFLGLLIVVLQEARLLRRLLPLDEGMGQDELDRSANKLNETLAGLSYHDIEAHPLELTSLEERVKRDTGAMMREAATGSLQEHHMDGLRRLLSQPEFSQSGRAGELVEMLEERVLQQTLISEAPREDDVAIYIGAENRNEALHSFGVILCRYGLLDELKGTICVVGPTRMGYPEAISGASYLSSVMSHLVEELQGEGSVEITEHTSSTR